MDHGANLFTRLHKWAAQQDENFLTESLALVVEQLLILAPEVGTRLISRLTGAFVEVSPGDASSIEIRTQIVAGQGRPDLDLPVLKAAGDGAVFLTRQLLDFLRTRGMTLAQVGKYLSEGARALGNLLNMLFEAAAICKVSAKMAAGRDYTGIHLDATKYWVGIDYSEPEKLWFGTRCRIDPGAAARVGSGELTQESWVPGRYRWWRVVELDSEEVHFFSRTKVSQIQWLERFLHECLDMARSIETPDQPPVPDEPEEK